MMTFVLQNGWSPLFAASCNGYRGVVKTLLEAGANINQANKVQQVDMYTGCHTCPYIVSPLHWLHVAPCYTCSTSYSTFIHVHVSNKYVMLYSQNGRTSLDLAMERGNNETIQLLKTYPNKVRCTYDEQ